MRGGQGRGAAVSRRRDNLPGVFIPKVTHRENSGNGCFAFFIGDHVALGGLLNGLRDNFVVRNKADKNKNTIRIQGPLLSGDRILEVNRADTI